MWDTDAPMLVFVMLNPSTADADVDDPTIRRCLEFASRDGYGGIVVVNLFAWRATDPRVLIKPPMFDAVGPLNDAAISNACQGADVVAAWGAQKFGRGRAKDVMQMLRIANRVLCLGRTADGSPRHPLYVRADTRLEPFGASRETRRDL